MLQALQGKAFESVKHLIEDDDWCVDKENGTKLLKLLARPQYYGKEELESLWNSMHKLFFSELRKPEDDSSAFRSKFESAVRKVRQHHVEMPPEALGFLYLRQAKVDTDTLERLITMTNGDLKLDTVIDAMRRLKMRLLEGEDQSNKKSHVWLQDFGSQESEVSMPENEEEDEVTILEQALQELDDNGSSIEEEVTEESAKEILMSLIKQKITRPVQMGYRAVQQKKAEVKNARGFRPVALSATTRRDVQALKAVTRCKNCNAVGHWHRECPTKQAPSGSSNANPPNAHGGATHNSWYSLAEAMDITQQEAIPESRNE